MATTTCPSCGSPLRAGARFCGSCGHVLGSPVKPDESLAQGVPVQGVPLQGGPGAGDAACPHCGKAVRQGANFCSSCGLSIEVAPESPAEAITRRSPAAVTQRSPAAVTLPAAERTLPAHPEAGDSAGLAPAPQLANATTARPAKAAPGRAADTMPPPAAPPATPSRRRWLGAGVLAAAVVCLAALGGGYVLAQRMGWINMGPLAEVPALLRSATPTASPEATPPAASPAGPTAASLPTVEATISPASTPSPDPAGYLATLSALVPPLLEETPPNAAPITAATTVTTSTILVSTSGAPFAPAPVLTPALVLFDDPFDNGLRAYWRTWGNPRPQVDSGPGDFWLYLKALDPPSAAGITSRPNFPIYNMPSTEISFEAQLLQNYPQTMLLFDWDPNPSDRGPEIHHPGLVHIELTPKQVRWLLPLTKETCQAELDAKLKHTYLLRFLEGQGAALYVDGDASPVCSTQFMGIAPVEGTITLTGAGWVTRVTVTQPEIP